jgi:hypothetical protein
VGVGEFQPSGGELIDIRGGDIGVSISGDIPDAHVIGEKQNDVGPLGLCKGLQDGAKNKERR